MAMDYMNDDDPDARSGILPATVMKCDSCGEPATHIRDNYDICPTDRGAEYRFYGEALCDDCDPVTQHSHPLMDAYMSTLSAYGYPRGRR